MSKTKKIVLSIVAVVVLLAIMCGVAYATAPRDFLQLVLSDSAYTKYTLGENLARIYPDLEDLFSDIDRKQVAFETDGALNIIFEDDLFPSVEFSKAASEYLSSMSLTTDLRLSGTVACIDANLHDAEGSVFTGQFISDARSAYLKIDQLETGYMDLLTKPNMESEDTEDEYSSPSSERSPGAIDETYDNIIDSGADDDLREIVYMLVETAMESFDDTLITVIQDKILEVGSVSAGGDVATVMMTAEDFKDAITNTLTLLAEDRETFTVLNACLPESKQMTYTQFKAKTLNIRDTCVEEIEESGVTNVTIEFYINKRNDIVGMDIEVMTPDSSTGVKAVIEDDENKGIAVAMDRDDIVTYSLNLAKTDESSGNIDIISQTEAGQIEITAKYINYVNESDKFGVRLQVEPFTLPGQENLGEIKMDISASVENKTLDLTGILDVVGLGNVTITLLGTEVEYTEFTLPGVSEVVPFDSDKIKSNAINYVLLDLPKTHPGLKDLYSAFIKSTLNDMFGGLFGGGTNVMINGNTGTISDSYSGSFSGSNLGNAIDGIVSGAITGYADADEIIGDLFSAFGIK